MDLSFKEKKTVCNFVVWFLKYQAKRKVVIFFGTPCTWIKNAIHRIGIELRTKSKMKNTPKINKNIKKKLI